MKSTDAFTVWLLSFPEQFADINNADKWQTLYLGDSKKFLYFYVLCLHVCLCSTCMAGGWGDRKRVCDLLELELQIVTSLWVLDKSLEPTWKARCITSKCNVSTSTVRWEMGRESGGRLEQPDWCLQHSSKTKRPWLNTMGKVIINSWSLSSNLPTTGTAAYLNLRTHADVHTHTENVTYKAVSWLSGQSLYDLSITFNKRDHKLHIKYSVFTAHSAQHINTLLTDQKESEQR